MVKTIFSLIFVLLLGSTALAQNTCGDLFFEEPVFSSHHLEQAQIRKNRFGHDMLLLQRKTVTPKRMLFLKGKPQLADWADYKTNPDKPGDIRWGAESLPEPMKRILDLRTYDIHMHPTEAMSAETFYVQVPTVPTSIKVVGLLEKQLQTRDPNVQLINYYEVRGLISAIKYLRRFVANLELPLAILGHLFEHDTNYHLYSSLIMPPVLARALQVRAELFLEFYKYVESRSYNSKAEAELKLFVEKVLLLELVSRIDYATGNLFRATIRMKNEPISKIMKEVHELQDMAFLGKPSPVEYLIQFLSHPGAGPILPVVLKDFIAQMPARFRHEDLSASMVLNPAELYNAVQDHVKRLGVAADAIIPP